MVTAMKDAVPVLVKNAARTSAGLDPNLNLVYDKPKTNYLMPKHLRENRLAPQEAAQLLSGMRAVAPHGALDKTRLDWHGLQIQGYGSRVHDNDRITRLGRWLHQMDGDQFEATHPDKTQGFGDAFLPYANLVTVPSGMGGTAMHELGHAIDYNAFPANSKLRHGAAALYRNYAPTLWKEHAAWKKGRKHVLDAYASDKLDPSVTYKTLESGKGAKRVGLGSYWGATLGTVGGAGLGIAGLAALANAGVDPEGLGRLAILPIALGGSLGAMGGIGLGNYLAKQPAKREQITKMMAKHLARKNNIGYSEAHAIVEKQLASTSNTTKKETPMRKAASLVDPAFIAPLAGAAVGGGIGALSSKKNRLRNALIGAGIGGSAGAAGEYTLPGLGLGGKYTAQDIAHVIKAKMMGNPGYLEGLSGAANRIGEMGEYSMRRHSTLPGLELAYLPGHFKKSDAIAFGQKLAAGPLTAEKPIAPNSYLRAAQDEQPGFLGINRTNKFLRAADAANIRLIDRHNQERHEDTTHAINRINATLGNNKPRVVPRTPSHQAKPLPTPPVVSPPRGTGAAGIKAGSALEFGAKLAEYAGMSDHTALVAGGTGLGARYGAMAGAALGGIHGLMSPGEVDGEDEDGNPIKRKRNRLMGALRGAAGGAGLGLVGGGAAGGLAQHLNPGLMTAIDPELDRHLLDRAAESRGQLPSYQRDFSNAHAKAHVGGMA